MTRVFRLMVVLWGSLLLLGAVALQNGKTPNPNAAPWWSFAQYPKARQLCWEYVLGTRGEEVRWTSFSTNDDLDRVVAFYTKTVGSPEKDEDGSMTFRHGTDDILEVHSASDTKHFQCEHKPRADEKTVIVVSRLLSRGGR